MCYYDTGDGYIDISGEVTSVSVVPEPATILLLAVGIIPLVRRQQKQKP
ncbi:MAG: PEP-CTERM sorting domain-containing protein [Planctomycetes bacterium]|nr:PEP-CTERM sorting domain-containing protein [Planctomycetota bacterium]